MNVPHWHRRTWRVRLVLVDLLFALSARLDAAAARLMDPRP